MKLEEHIKQKAFKSQLEKAMINIAFTHSYIAGSMNKVFKPYNISMQQFNVMRILKGQYPEAVSINDITDRMVDKMSNASRLVEKLRQKNYVKRTTCKFDRRQVDVSLTDEGLALLDTLNHLTLENQNQFSHITEEEYETLNNIMDKMRDAKENGSL